MKYTSKDYEGFRTDMIADLQTRIPEYTDTSSSDVGIVIIELLAYALDSLSYYLDVIANEVFMSTAQERRSVLEHTSNIGYVMGNAKPSKVYVVFEISPSASPFIIPQGFLLKTDETSTEEPIFFELDEDLVIPIGATGLEEGDGGYVHKVSATQGFIIPEELLGSSDGTPTQEFSLSQAPVVDDSIRVAVDEGTGYVEWNRVDNFINSSPTDTHFTIVPLDNDAFKIRFGSGGAGKVPEIINNGIVASYRVGGGTIGNVGANTIVNYHEAIAGIVDVFNPEAPYQLGEEAEDLELAKIRAVASLRTKWGAVTIQDYTDLAILLPTVRLANAIEGGIADELSIYLYVVPVDSTTVSIELETELLAYFDERKSIGYVVHIENATFVDFELNVDIKTFSNVSIVRMEELIEEFVMEYFEVGNFDFGQEVIPSSLIKELANIDGVKSVNVEIVGGDGTVLPTEVAVLNVLNLTVTGGV